MAFEVGNVVKIMISNQPWRGVIVTYTNDNPPIYEVRVDDLKQIFTAKEDELSLLSEGSGGGGGGGDSTGGYDAVFRYSCDWDNVLGYINWTAELVSGSFEAAKAKAFSGQPMRFLSVLYLPQEGDIRDYTMTAFGAPGGYYTSVAAAPLTGIFILRDYLQTDRADPKITVEWSSNDTIIVTQD